MYKRLQITRHANTYHVYPNFNMHTWSDDFDVKLSTKYVDDADWLPNDFEALIQREENDFGLVII